MTSEKHSKKRSITKHTRKSVVKKPFNFLEHRLIKMYFEAKEHYAYYRSLKHAFTRIEFHHSLINTYEKAGCQVKKLC